MGLSIRPHCCHTGSSLVSQFWSPSFGITLSPGPDSLPWKPTSPQSMENLACLVLIFSTLGREILGLNFCLMAGVLHSSDRLNDPEGFRALPAPTAWSLVTLSDLFLDVILFTQFVCQITEGGGRKETWSSVNYLFFISTSLIYGKNQQARQGIVWSKDLKSVLGPEISRAWGTWFKMLVTI